MATNGAHSGHSLPHPLPNASALAGSDYSRGSGAQNRYPAPSYPAATESDSRHDWSQFPYRTLPDPRAGSAPASGQRSPFDYPHSATTPSTDSQFYHFQNSLYSPRDSHPPPPFRSSSGHTQTPLSMSPVGHQPQSAGDWPYTSGQAAISDGAPLVHLSPPLGAIHSADPDAGASQAPAASRPAVGRVRKNRKPSDEPNSLDELREPPPGEKPDYSYPTLIRCAILSHSRTKPTLAEIYDMIHKRFNFFKMDDTSWKNSVRHYLSINPCFVKVQRPITEPGKGNYWTFDPNPPAKAPRRRTNRKRPKPDRDDDDDGAFHDGGARNKSFRIDSGATDSPTLAPSDGGCTPSSSDMGDGGAGAHGSAPPSAGAAPAVRIASHRTNPAYQWLESNKQHRLRHHENLPGPGVLPAPLLPPPTKTASQRPPLSFDAPFSPGLPSSYATPLRGPAPPSSFPGPGLFGAGLDPPGAFRPPSAQFGSASLPPLQLDPLGAVSDTRGSRGPRGVDDLRPPGSLGTFDMRPLNAQPSPYSDAAPRMRAPEHGDARSGHGAGW